MKVKDCMCHEVAYLTPESTIQDCAKLMCNKHVGCIPICDENKTIVGLVTDRDVILRSIACNKDIKTTPVSDIMTCQVCSCGPDEEINEAEKKMSNEQIRRLPVVDENNKIIGIITLGDLCANQNVNTNEKSQTLEKICKDNNKNAE